MKKTLCCFIAFLLSSIFIYAQNPTGYIAEKTDDTAASLNLKNINGFWHLSGPRSYELNNKLSIFWNDGTYHRLMSINDNGYVGIGTASPLHKLDVRGVISSSHDNGNKINLFTSGDGNSYLNFLGGSSSSRIGFQIDGASKMSIYSNGGVSIGSGNPGSYKLAVNGSIRAKEIKVETGWADYVFKEGYDLPTLEEVERHIKEKGHLPNIPSAKEVETNGVELGEMNRLLLEKIEELTLYIIDLKKENSQLKEEITSIKNFEKRLCNLETQLNKS